MLLTSPAAREVGRWGESGREEKELQGEVGVLSAQGTAHAFGQKTSFLRCPWSLARAANIPGRVGGAGAHVRESLLMAWGRPGSPTLGT